MILDAEQCVGCAWCTLYCPVDAISMKGSREGDERALKAPCQAKCPVELDCAGYIALIKEGKFEDSFRLIRQRLPLPLTVGRVCHHPCEEICRRGLMDDAIAIRNLKRVVADFALENKIEYMPKVKPKKVERVAIVGAGPAGLAAAHDLAKEGYQITIFEALPAVGGMMAVGIPAYRLPREMLKADLAWVKKLGIEIKLNTKINDVGALLREGYRAVLIAVGAHQGTKIGVPGEDLNGVFDAIEFLRKVNLGQKVDVGNRVAVVGGGNSAIDAAKVALREGAKEVHVFYRREKDDMPAIGDEVEEAEKEGIKLHLLTVPVRIMGKDGKVSGLECVRTELRERDSSGRRRPYIINGSEYSVSVDTVIQAIGQIPDIALVKGSQVKTSRDGNVAVDPKTLATDQKGIFAAGDAATGGKSVIDAIASGQMAAASIIHYLQGKELLPYLDRGDEELIPISSVQPTEAELQEKARVKMAELGMKERVSSFKEILSGYTPQQAKQEAARCVRCDLDVARIDLVECVECDVCYRSDICPVGALHPIPSTEIGWPRVIRAVLSNPRVESPDTRVPGRGTEEVKTNEVSGRIKPGFVGLAIELGRPGTGTRFHDVQKVTQAMAEAGAMFEPENPVTVWMTDRKTGRLRDDILNEKSLTAIVECAFPIDKLKPAIEKLRKVTEELNTVCSVCSAVKLAPDGSVPTEPIFKELGITPRPNSKNNVGLGRPLFKFKEVSQ